MFGSRSWTDGGVVLTVLRGVLATAGGPLVVIEGCCPTGADAFAHGIAHPDIDHEHYPAAWGEHDRAGTSGVRCRCDSDARSCRAAGVRRNERMIRDGRPDLAWGFAVDLAHSPGSRDMRERCRRSGVPYYMVGQ